MRIEQMFAPTEREITQRPNGSGHPITSHGAADDRIEALLAELERIEIRPMSRPRADRTLGLLSRMQAVAASKMCDVTGRVSESDSGSEPAEVLRSKARLSGRESKRMAKVARQLSDMPKVREKFAEGRINLDQATVLANAAERVGPDTVEADPHLLESADRMLPDTFQQHARKWSEGKLIERGVNPLERQRRAREAKLWVEDRTGLGTLLAKLPATQFNHLRQAIDHHYLQLRRRDGADGRDPDSVRSPKQRLADAVFELMTNRDAGTGEFIDHMPNVKAKAATQLILIAPMGVVDGTNSQAHVEMIGTGPVPREILETLTRTPSWPGWSSTGPADPCGWAATSASPTQSSASP